MIIEKELFMSQLNQKRKIFIYLPKDYETSKESYPVLYTFDGHNLFLDSYATYGRAIHIQDHIENLGLKLIVVGQECSHEGNNRLNEYAPYSFYDPEFGSFEGLGQKTMDFFVNELKPYIDQNYRTKKTRKYTFIAGSSCGGLMSLYAAYAYSNVYSKAVVVSPYILESIEAILNDISKQNIQKNTSIYLSWGSNESDAMHEFVWQTKACTEVANALNKKGVKVLFNVVPDGRHCEEDWEKECDQFLPFLFQ